MDIEIRILNGKDAEAFWKLRLEALEQEPGAFAESAEEHRAKTRKSTTELLNSPRPGNFLLGAFVDGQLVGSIGLMRYDRIKQRHKARVWGVYVQAEHRAQGLGQRMLAELLRLARSQPGLEQILLTVGQHQTAAKRLYASLGFEVFGHEPGALKVGDNYVDEDYMLLQLERPVKSGPAGAPENS